MGDDIPLTYAAKSPKTVAEFSSFYGDSVSAAKFSRFTKHLRVFQTVWQDVKLITDPLHNYARSFSIHPTFILSLTAAVAGNYYLYLESNAALSAANMFCGPGGNFDISGAFHIWAVEHTFQITLGFGSITFAQAKAADIVWDAVVGRGGQIILVAVCFQAFSKSLSRILEQPNGSVSHNAFKAIVFENPSLSSIYELIRDFGSIMGWRSKVSMLWMILASIYVAAFPTMTSAMTGYSANVVPYFNNTDSATPVNENIFHRAIYRIDDAHRIEGLGLDMNYIVGSQGFTEGWNTTTADQDYYYCLNQSPETESNLRDCYLARGISDYINRYGLGLSQEINSTLSVNRTNYDIRSPPLSIAVFNTYSNPYWGSVMHLSMDNATNLPIFYTTDNGSITYDTKTINNELGICIPQNTYMWGFSFILLFSFLSITSIWMLGMYILWNDAFWNSKLDRAGRQMGFYRGVVDVSNAIREDMLGEIGSLVTESEIRTMITKKPHSSRIWYDDIHRGQLPQSRRRAFLCFSRTVPSLQGWTGTWAPLHWVWLMTFVAIGFAWGFIPIALHLESGTMLQLATIVSFVTTGVLWLMTVAMLLTAIPQLARYRCRIPVFGRWFEPRTTSHWALTAVFAVVGLYVFYSALVTGYFSTSYDTNSPLEFSSDFLMGQLSDNTLSNMSLSVSIANFLFAGLFWLVAAVMLLVGICSTLYRWSIWLKHVVLPWYQGHRAIHSIESTSYSVI